MSASYETRFFLGANSAGGFRSLYDDFTDSARDRLYILKGGPGCGKSTLMKTLGRAVRESGRSVEYVHCSGDPDSLDAVYFPELRVGYVDGTSPHVVEPRFAGACESYINLGSFYDLGELEARRGAIMELTELYKSHYARAFRLLSAAASLMGPPLPEEALIAVAKRAPGIISRELRPQTKSHGRTVKRFLSAYTCKGRMCFFDTVDALAERVYVLDNELGLAHILIEAIAAAAEARGFDSVRCQSPLFPEVTEHLILPELSLAFVSRTSKMPYEGESARHLRLDALADRVRSAEEKAESRRLAKLREAAITEAIDKLRLAKEAHDLLEQQYIPAMDFDGVDAVARLHLDQLLR